MATCDIIALRAAAVANRFDRLSPTQRGALELQFWYALTGSTKTVDELKADACASGFTCVSGRATLAAKLQLLCNGGTAAPVVPSECVNLIPEGAMYDDAGGYEILGITAGTTYQITFGGNDQQVQPVVGGSGPYQILVSPGIGVTVQVVTVEDNLFFGGANLDLVTATICAI